MAANAECQALLRTANRLFRFEDLHRARALLEIMSDVYPDEPQVWAALATMATDDAEMTTFLARASHVRKCEACLTPDNPVSVRHASRVRKCEACLTPDNPP